MVIDTLVEDIYKVLDGHGGWDNYIAMHHASLTEKTTLSRLKKVEGEPKGTLRMSNLGSPCTRKLWYHINEPSKGEPLRPSTKLKFLYGDLLEDLLICLAKAAGHSVEGTQDRLEIDGLVGHRDCVIDGMTVDVKSASSYAFKKFKEHRLEEEDPFAYLEQLSSYVYAGKDDPLVEDKTHGAFLAINKESGELVLDVYSLEDKIKGKQEKIESVRKDCYSPTPPDIAFKPVAEGKSGNMKLGTFCSYCDYKNLCHPELRTFIYSTGPKFFTKVKKEPNVMEVKE